MANAYGLDFLKARHKLDDDGQPKVESFQHAPSMTFNDDISGGDGGVSALAASVAHKPDLEKQFDVIHFLQAHRSAGCLAPNVIYKATGIDLEEADESVAKMLQHNPKIRVEQVPDPENPSIMIATYAYQAKYNHVRDRTTLLAQINRCKNGVPMRDLLDAYDGVEYDIGGLITAGDVLAIINTEDKDKILFPRGDAFLVELDGIISCPGALGNDGMVSATQTQQLQSQKNGMHVDGVNGHHHNMNGKNTNSGDLSASYHHDHKQKPIYVVECDVDPRNQIRRGEAVNVGGQWFRVSSAVRDGLPLSEQPVRAQAPLSVVSLSDLSKRNLHDGYIRDFTAKQLPLDAALSATGISNLVKSKQARERLHKLAHGRSSMSGGVAAQLLSSNAHESNPATLALSFAASAGGSGNLRKRPTSNKMSHTSQFNKEERRKATLAAQEAASDPALSKSSHARRHGCTRNVREMYLATRKDIPESDSEIHKLLLEHKLLEHDEQMRRPRLAKRANVDNDGKPKKRRYYERKNQRMTNTHLEGTEIGAVLRRATEKQRQGKSVGDGGM